MPSRPSLSGRRQPAGTRQPKVTVTDGDLRYVRLALIGGVIVPLIAATAGIVGTVVGTRIQGADSRAISSFEFNREQRLAVYSEFIDSYEAEVRAFNGLVLARRDTVAGEPSASVEYTYDQAQLEYLKASRGTSRVMNKVLLVGSANAQSAGIDILSIFADSFTELVYSDVDTVKEVSALSQYFSEEYGDLAERFMRAAIDDLQSD